ncbi:MAG: helix-turn-helix transcriptional regulator [Fibromonadales bacterium]|nr:helix-turn-helix transcriptional regulator [Fibromonadales bacterium]
MEAKNGIRNFRKRLQLNQVELAEKLGIGQQAISTWESDKGYPSFLVAKQMLEMGATVEELFGIPYNNSVTTSKVDFTDAELGDFVKRGLKFLVGN